MKAHRSYIIFMLFICFLSIPLPAHAKKMPIFRGREVPLALDTGTQPSECTIKSITKITEGTRPDWSHDGKFIGFDKVVNGNSEVFLINPDGSNPQCLTCNSERKEFKDRHKGKVTFHPDGQYILFSVENEYGKHDFTSSPGVGDNHDFWLTDLKRSQFLRLTKTPQGSALQYPRFSSNGQKLLWSERYEKGRIKKMGHEFGLWKMKLADFTVTADGPVLTHITEFQPGGEGFYEPHGFSPDGAKIIFTAMLDPRKSQFYGEIYTFDLKSRKMTKLAEADDLHFEQALYSPSGKKISFMSGPFIGILKVAYKTDLYLMDSDGQNRVRLTYFNDPDHADYQGGHALIDKNVWSQDGTKLIFGRYIHKKREQSVLAVNFQGACGGL